MMNLTKGWTSLIFVIASVIAHLCGLPLYLPALINWLWGIAFSVVIACFMWDNRERNDKDSYDRGFEDGVASVKDVPDDLP